MRRANFAAYLSFQRWLCDPQHLRRVRRPNEDTHLELEGKGLLLEGLKTRTDLNGQRVRVGKLDVSRGRYSVRLPSGEVILVRRLNLVSYESEWCRKRQISHTSILATARTVEHVLSTLYHYFPPLLHRNLELRAAQSEAPTCAPAEGAVGASIFAMLVSKRAERLLRKLVQVLRIAQDRRAETASQPSDKDGPCFFFRRGCCSVDGCPFSHQNSADTRPVCKFALSGTCKFGAARCRNRHPVVAAYATEQHADVRVLQGNVQLGLGSLISSGLFTRSTLAVDEGVAANCRPPADYLAYHSVLLCGEGDFTFAAALASRASGRG